MKVACVTTTINVPRVLALYAKYAPYVMFFVIGDRKTPDMQVVEFLTDHVPNHVYYGIDAQYKLGHKCARLIPENCVQRRNIGFLEALKWGADIVVSIDDDNIPLDSNYFEHFHVAGLDKQFFTDFHGIKASSLSRWFDVGTLLQPKAEHRGFPHTRRAEPVFESIVDAKVGVAAGICLGDPDISAVTRIATGPIVHGTSALLQDGVVVDPRETWTVFNSQNTAVIRELVPAWFMIPHIGRYDDIFGSLVCQRVMCETGHHVHFGKPMVWQQRNQHDLGSDLLAELMGMRTIEAFAKYLGEISPVGTMLERTRVLWAGMLDFGVPMLPKDSIEAALAWCDDCEWVMK